MKTGPKYKIARRLGAPIFEKTQTAKYTLSLSRKEKTGRRGRPKSEYGAALIEKQKARFTYGLTERQFRVYVDKALSKASTALLIASPVQKLFTLLETRLDNTLYRAGLAKTRAAARQIAGHGHALVNGRRVTIPSIHLKTGDTVSLRAGSADSPLFTDAGERMKTLTVPAWLTVDPENATAGSVFKIEVAGEPVYAPAEHLFDLGVAIEFYNR